MAEDLELIPSSRSLPSSLAARFALPGAGHSERNWRHFTVLPLEGTSPYPPTEGVQMDRSHSRRKEYFLVGTTTKREWGTKQQTLGSSDLDSRAQVWLRPRLPLPCYPQRYMRPIWAPFFLPSLPYPIPSKAQPPSDAQTPMHHTVVLRFGM